jgi:hypothetical protein
MQPYDLVRLRRNHQKVGVVVRVAGGAVLVRWLFKPGAELFYKQASLEIVGRYSGSQ